MKGNKISLPIWLSSLCRAGHYYIGSGEQKILHSWMGSISQISRDLQESPEQEWPEPCSEFFCLSPLAVRSIPHQASSTESAREQDTDGGERDSIRYGFNPSQSLQGLYTMGFLSMWKQVVLSHYSTPCFTFFVLVENKITNSLRLKQSSVWHKQRRMESSSHEGSRGRRAPSRCSIKTSP